MLPAVTWPLGHPRGCGQLWLGQKLVFADTQQAMLRIETRKLSGSRNTGESHLDKLKELKKYSHGQSIAGWGILCGLQRVRCYEVLGGRGQTSQNLELNKGFGLYCENRGIIRGL